MKFDDFLWLCNAVYNQKKIEMDEKLHPLFLQKGDLRITKNYRGIILNTIAATVYNTLFIKHIQPKVEKILRKNQNSFQRNQSTVFQIYHIIEGVCAKKSQNNTCL